MRSLITFFYKNRPTNFLPKIYLVLLLITIFSCQSPQKTESNLSEIDMESVANITQTNCGSCHQFSSDKNPVAPTLLEIQSAYNEKFKTYSKATSHMIDFLNAPSLDNIVMQNAVEKYGLMPKFNYNNDELNQIVEFILKANFNAKDWTNNSPHIPSKGIKKEVTDYLAHGQKIANETKMVLGKNLLNALKDKGTIGALEFCNLRALPLTDSVSFALNASVRRVTDKPRNPKNRANKYELEYINELKALHSNGHLLSPRLTEKGDKIIAYYPIETNEMCMKCHGEIDNDIDTQVLSTIKSLYPKDMALGYTSNQIRGIFVVEMSKNQ